MEKEGQPGASGMESKMKSFSGKAKKPGPCDFKLAYISLWWRRMEREGLKEKFENDMEKKRNQGTNAIKAFLVKNSQNTHTRSENNSRD